jgi:hypothetical protein
MTNNEIKARVERVKKIRDFCKGEGMSVKEMCEACGGILAVYASQLKRMLADTNEEGKGDEDGN